MTRSGKYGKNLKLFVVWISEKLLVIFGQMSMLAVWRLDKRGDSRQEYQVRSQVHDLGKE